MFNVVLHGSLSSFTFASGLINCVILFMFVTVGYKCFPGSSPMNHTWNMEIGNQHFCTSLMCFCLSALSFDILFRRVPSAFNHTCWPATSTNIRLWSNVRLQPAVLTVSNAVFQRSLCWWGYIMLLEPVTCFVITATAKCPSSHKTMGLMTEVLLAPTQTGIYLQPSAYVGHRQQQQEKVGHLISCLQVRPCISPSCAENVPLKSRAACNAHSKPYFMEASQELYLRWDQLTQCIFLSLQLQWNFTKEGTHIQKLTRNSHLHTAAIFGTLELSEVTELEIGRLGMLHGTRF